MANKEQEQLVALVDSLNERFSELIRDIKDAASIHAFTAYAEARNGWCYPSHVVAFDEFVRGLFDALADVHKEGKQLLGRNDEPLEDEEDEEDEEERNERVLDSIETRFDVAFDALRRAGKDVLTSREQLDSFLYGLRLKAERVLESYDETEEETNVPVVESNDDDMDDETGVDETEDYTVEYIPPLDIDCLDEKEEESVRENVSYLFATALATLKRAVQADVYLSRDDLERLTNDVKKSIDDAWNERDKTSTRRGSTECYMNRRRAIERLRRDDLTR